MSADDHEVEAHGKPDHPSETGGGVEPTLLLAYLLGIVQEYRYASHHRDINQDTIDTQPRTSRMSRGPNRVDVQIARADS